MAALTIRNIPDEIHRALRVRAAQHGLSTEAEVRLILSNTITAEPRLRLGDSLMRLGQQIGFSDNDIDHLVTSREPATPMSFE